MSRGTSYPSLPKGWCCYLLQCADGSYYCGITTNLAQRLHQHATGRGARYTRARRAVTLAWWERHKNRSAATRRESQLKKWSHARKRELVRGRLRLSARARAVRVRVRADRRRRSL